MSNFEQFDEQRAFAYMFIAATALDDINNLGVRYERIYMYNETVETNVQ